MHEYVELKHCNNLIELSLSRTKLEPKQLGAILHHMRRLQRLDVQWDINIKDLLQVIGMNFSLRQLTIRLKPSIVYNIAGKNSFLDYWLSTGFVPQNLMIVTCPTSTFVKVPCHGWEKLKHRSPAAFAGHTKVYKSLKAQLNMYPVLPEFQLDFGKKLTLPIVKPSSVGLLLGSKDCVLGITDCTCGDKVMQKAVLTSIPSVVYKEDCFNESVYL